MLELTGLAHELHDAQVGVVIYIQRGLVDRGHLRDNLVHLVTVQLAVAELGLVHLGPGTKQTLCQLHAVHFQTKEGHVLVVVDGSVGRDGQGKRGLSHARTGRQDNQVRILEAVGQLVQLFDTRGDSRDAVLAVVEPLQQGRNEILDGLYSTLHLLVGDGENVPLRILDHIVRIEGRVHGLLDGLRGRLDHPAQGGLVLQVFQVPLHVGRRRHRLHQVEKVFPAARLGELAVAFQFRRKGQKVDGSTLAV